MAGPQNLDAFRRTIGQGLSDDEWRLLVATAERTQLDPVARQLFAIKRGGRMSIQTSIDGFRLVAERSTRYAGQIGPHWCGTDGTWRDVWLAKENPAAARVGVLRADFKEPLFAIAKWNEYAQSGGMWTKMPALMLGKCAESLALRRAFPQELSGLYTAEEMGQSEATPRVPAQRHPANDEEGPPPGAEAEDLRERIAALLPDVPEQKRSAVERAVKVAGDNVERLKAGLAFVRGLVSPAHEVEAQAESEAS